VAQAVNPASRASLEAVRQAACSARAPADRCSPRRSARRCDRARRSARRAAARAVSGRAPSGPLPPASPPAATPTSGARSTAGAPPIGPSATAARAWPSSVACASVARRVRRRNLPGPGARRELHLEDDGPRARAGRAGGRRATASAWAMMAPRMRPVVTQCRCRRCPPRRRCARRDRARPGARPHRAARRAR
jgi:hypothetical protein